MPSRRSVVLALAFLLVASLAWAHDLFLKLDTWFLPPNAHARILAFNGTFDKSENFIAPSRIVDVSVVSPAGRTRLAAESAWSRGPDSASVLSFDVGEAGTYVVGVSLRPNQIGLTAAEFNAYLKEDGIDDVLEARRVNNELNRPARERYSKHVKALLQVGATPGDAFGTTLGYPAELVPLDNPYAMDGATTLRLRCLVDGRPVARQMVLWGGERQGKPLPQRSVRSGADGVAEVTLDGPGRWYVKFIYMDRTTQPGLDYESKWATLTFETR